MGYILFALAGYLSGSILYAYLLPKWFCNIDITQHSKDKNPGTANAFEFAGINIGILVVVCELAKAFLPVFLAKRVLDIGDPMFALVIAAPVFGHAFPFWCITKGGKSIAASFGTLLGLLPTQYMPVLILAICYILFSIIIIIRPHIYRSIVTYMIFSILSFFMVDVASIVIASCLISAVVIFKHLKRYDGERFQVSTALSEIHTK